MHLLADVRPAAPVPSPPGSIAPWLVAIVVLAVLVAGSVYLASRR